MIFRLVLVLAFLLRTTRSVKDGRALRKHLLENYDPLTRPIRNQSAPIRVELSIMMAQLLGVDSLKQRLTAFLYISKVWKDDFLRWNNTEYGVDETLLLKNTVWVPDVYIYNLMEEMKFLSPHKFVKVSSQGEVSFFENIQASIPCNIFVRYFPYDQQNCQFFIASTSYNKDQLELLNSKNHQLEPYFVNTEWNITNFSTNIFTYTKANNSIHVFNFTLTVERYPAHYLWYLLLPSCSLLFLGAVAFCLPANGDRLAFNASTLVAFTVFLLLIPSHLPSQTNQLPIMGVFLGICVVLLTGSTCCTVLGMAWRWKLGGSSRLGYKEEEECYEKKEKKQLRLDRCFAAVFLVGFLINLANFFIEIKN